ncbi:hypothetical protein CDO52_19780 [Nocardiopsis gilva YIM 90087]|uniref:Transcription factor zinc-finger domain-containing protein n=1 Tax=Nocardiopsis gilva YIM 90087 TaxID=1235441 RepID=A0A223S9G5_9ACTN|nr:hypothetical protein CDO52_19780 [Nocardiopsis gilva YIM 90087]
MCGLLDVAEMLAERTGERLWLCGECDAVWLEGDDLSEPPYSSLTDYEPVGGASWDEFRVVRDDPSDA